MDRNKYVEGDESLRHSEWQIPEKVIQDSLREESLREAACTGDIEMIEMLLDNSSIDVNAKHKINGWTALHWAAKRNHKDIVALLLKKGADKTITTNKGELAATLCSNPDILKLLEESSITTSGNESSHSLPIVPSYLKNPQLPNMKKVNYVDTAISAPIVTNIAGKCGNVSNGCFTNDELVLKVRVGNSGDSDFIEVEIPRNELTYNKLLRVCCEELGVNAKHVLRLRKLPDTLIRKDKDVQRFRDFQEIEVVTTSSVQNRIPGGSNGYINVPGAAGTNANGYQSISLYKNQTILY